MSQITIKNIENILSKMIELIDSGLSDDAINAMIEHKKDLIEQNMQGNIDDSCSKKINHLLIEIFEKCVEKEKIYDFEKLFKYQDWKLSEKINLILIKNHNKTFFLNGFLCENDYGLTFNYSFFLELFVIKNYDPEINKTLNDLLLFDGQNQTKTNEMYADNIRKLILLKNSDLTLFFIQRFNGLREEYLSEFIGSRNLISLIISSEISTDYQFPIDLTKLIIGKSSINTMKYELLELSSDIYKKDNLFNIWIELFQKINEKEKDLFMKPLFISMKYDFDLNCKKVLEQYRKYCSNKEIMESLLNYMENRIDEFEYEINYEDKNTASLFLYNFKNLINEYSNNEKTHKQINEICNRLNEFDSKQIWFKDSFKSLVKQVSSVKKINKIILKK